MNELEQKIMDQTIADHDYVVGLRRYFHEHPEIAKEEFNTQKRIEEEEARKRSEEQTKSSYTSIADSAKTHKSAFFKRAQAQSGHDQTASDQEEHSSAYGGIVRPSAVVDEERDFKKSASIPAMGEALEGQRPSIMDPNMTVAPTASKPMEGFKGINGKNNKYPGRPSDNDRDV